MFYNPIQILKLYAVIDFTLCANFKRHAAGIVSVVLYQLSEEYSDLKISKPPIVLDQVTGARYYDGRLTYLREITSSTGPQHMAKKSEHHHLEESAMPEEVGIEYLSTFRFYLRRAPRFEVFCISILSSRVLWRTIE
jgi:hypothetical protein